MGIIDLPMQDEGVDAIKRLDLLIGVAKCRGLQRFSLRAIWRVKSLLAENNVP